MILIIKNKKQTNINSSNNNFESSEANFVTYVTYLLETLYAKLFMYAPY